MTRLRSFIPAPLQVLGIASIFAVGIAIGAQNQDEPKATQPKTPAKTAPKPAADAATADPAAPANSRAQPRAAEAKTPTEQKQSAALGAKFDAQGNQGMIVTTVDQNGIFAHSGLRQNDRIISAEGFTFSSPRQFEAWLWSQPGRQVPVIIDRGGQHYTLQVAMPQYGANMGWLGVNVDEGDADVKGEANVKGARVTQVYPSGPASRAGVQAGDVILQINQQPVEGSADAVLLIRELQPQTTAELVVMRDKEEMKIPVTVGSRANSNYQSFYRGQQPPNFQQGQQWNPNDQRFAGNDQGNHSGGNNQFHGIPPHAMELEYTRRTAEQNERIENELIQLREEVKKLRELLEKK